MDVSVVIATFGAEHWRELAQRAAASVPDGIPVHLVHADTLHEGRNQGLDQVTTQWVCHLDADDELTPGYFEAMAAGSADVRAPSVSYVVDDRQRPATMPRVWAHRHQCFAACLPEGNWIVIGALVRTELLRAVGGWRDFDWSEDWAAFAKCWKAGATIEAIPAAVYRAHVRADSRNRAPEQAAKLAAHHAIHRYVWPELYNDQLAGILERFKSKIVKDPDGCWEWDGTRNSDGYGSFWNGERFPGRNGKRGGPVSVLAHRWAYAHFVNEIPDGLCVLHRCDNPGCVNPRHLFLGTQADNVRDCADKGRRNQTRYKKLSAEIHAEIRERYGTPLPAAGPNPRGTGGISQQELADEYGVAQTVISYILRTGQAEAATDGRGAQSAVSGQASERAA